MLDYEVVGKVILTPARKLFKLQRCTVAAVTAPNGWKTFVQRYEFGMLVCRTPRCPDKKVTRAIYFTSDLSLAIFSLACFSSAALNNGSFT